MSCSSFVLALAVATITACANVPVVRRAPKEEPALRPGVSLELARHRAATLRDVRYTLDLDVRPADRVEGTVTVTVARASDAGNLVLDFRGTSLGDVSVNGSRVADLRWAHDHIVIPAAHLVTGANAVQIAFTAPVAPTGAAVITYDDAPARTRYLYTLLVPSDAQLLFPVFDQPDIKARFTWRVLAPRGWTVLTNGALLARDEQAAPNATRWSFAETEPISTYVAAFAAGPYAVLGGYDAPPASTAPDTAPNGDVARAMRLLVRRSRVAEVDTTELLRLNRQGLRWLERYFDYRYPFGKLDVLLAPAFPFGGMEHAGAIFYNESTFIFREPPTLTRQLARAATIYHEIAHQWFGDLVTMKWFDDLWLKEGFSTFMAAKMQQDLHPESGAWKTFYLRNKPAAYAIDVTAGTTPVWQELPNLDLAKSNYGAIVYNKAPAVLKQLEFLVGEDAFRRGLQLFLKRHAYANATWRDLLAAVAETSGSDLRAFGEHYILRAGLPLIETELALSDDGRIRSLALLQRPARDMPGDRGDGWPGRVRVRLGYAAGDDVVLDVTFAGERTEVPTARGLPAPDFVFPNDGDFGYGIFLPDQRSADWLLGSAFELKDELLRALAWGALWDLVREARLAPGRFVDAALQALDSERDEQIAGTLLGRIGYALDRLIPQGAAADRRAAALENHLLRRVDDASLDYGLRRSALDALLAGARSPAARTALKEYLSGARAFDGKPLGQPSRWNAITRLLALDEAGARALFDTEQARDSTPEAPRMRFIAGAAIPTAENKDIYYRRYFDDASLNEEWVTASLGAFNHELHAALTLPYLRRALESSTWLRDNRRIFFLPRWLEAFIGAHSSPRALQIVDAFLAAEEDLPLDVRRRILQARDELERVVRIRARFAVPRDTRQSTPELVPATHDGSTAAEVAREPGDFCPAEPASASVTGAPSTDLYCIELIPRPDLFGRAHGVVQLAPPASPFTLAVTRDGRHRHRTTFFIRGLPDPARLGAGLTTYVAWAAPLNLFPLVRLGAVRNGRVAAGELALNKFYILVSAEAADTVSDRRGPLVLRGLSPSTRMRDPHLLIASPGVATERATREHAAHEHEQRAPTQDEHARWSMPPHDPRVAQVPMGIEHLLPDATPFLPGAGLDAASLPLVRPRQPIEARDGDTITLRAGLVRRRIKGRDVVMYAFNGQQPGPLVHVRQAATLTIDFHNDTPHETAVHWHGIRLDNRFDGVPHVTQEPVPPGGSFRYTVHVPDAGIYWYHPHHREDVQQDLGLYGNLLVRSAEPGYFGPAHREQVLMLDDLLVGDGGLVPYGSEHATFALMGRFGNALLVNGEPRYTLNVRLGEVVRFHLTNASNTRTFNLTIDHARLKLIASDVGRYEREEWVESVVLAPAERYVVDVRFERAGTAVLTNRVQAIDHMMGAFLPLVDTLGAITVDSAPAAPDLGASFDSLRAPRAVAAELEQYRPHFGRAPDLTLDLALEDRGLPWEMLRVMRLDTLYFNPVEWAGTMPMMDWLATAAQVRWVLRDAASGAENDAIRWHFRRGDVVRIRLRNQRHSLHAMQHPIHIHGQRFLTLAINGVATANLVWKDTVLVPVGSTVDLLVELSNPGRWMVHCHIAEHLEAGMHFVFDVAR